MMAITSRVECRISTGLNEIASNGYKYTIPYGTTGFKRWETEL